MLSDFRLIRSGLLSLCVLVVATCAQTASADTFTVTYYAAGVQASTASSFVENFNSAAPAGGVLTTNFNGSSVTGTYTGGFVLSNADVFGGASGTGRYLTTRSTYSLDLSSGVNYFGLWFSALDNGNQLTFYNGSTLLYSFTPAAFSALVGACPSASGFCGNPNGSGNGGQQYAFLNFYDSNGMFNKITFTENPTIGGFESDNHTLGNISTGPGGTVIDGPVPEPSTLVLLGTGLLSVVRPLSRRLAKN